MKTLIAVPTMDTVPTLFVSAMLQLQKVGEVEISFTMSSLIYDARNNLAERAVKNGFERILWLDSDMTFEPDLMQRLSARLDEGYEYVSGLYMTRKAPIQPVVYREVGINTELGYGLPYAQSFMDYPDGIFEVAGTGFGGCMMTTALVKEVADNFGLPFSPILGFGEDLSFCQKVQQLGKKVYCDSTIKMGHVGYSVFTEKDFLMRSGRNGKNESTV